MNSRERVIRSITFKKPDRVPVLHRIKPGYFREHGKAIEGLRQKYPSDILQSPRTHSWFGFYTPGWYDTKPGELRKDEWGCTWANLTADHSGMVVDHPIKEWQDLKHYHLPDPHFGEEGLREMEEVRKFDHRQHYMMAWAGSIFHTYTYVRGFENALVDIVEKRAEFFQLLELLVEFLIERIHILNQYDIDAILITDDWGSQANLMINPRQWREVFKPYYIRLVEAIHAKETFAHYHTCGYSLPILDDLVEIGFDEINSQVPLMDIEKVGQALKRKVCIRPDLDRQNILSYGTPEEVEEHVKATFTALKTENGGYIGHIPVEMTVPLKNVEAMMKTYRELTFEP